MTAAGKAGGREQVTTRRLKRLDKEAGQPGRLKRPMSETPVRSRSRLTSIERRKMEENSGGAQVIRKRMKENRSDGTEENRREN